MIAVCDGEATLLAHLDEGRRQAGRGEILIEAQRRIVASFSATGSDVTQAERILDAFEWTQDLRLGDIDRLLDELDKLSL